MTVTAEAQRGERRGRRTLGAADRRALRSGAWLVPLVATAPLILWYVRGGPAVLYNVVGLAAVAGAAIANARLVNEGTTRDADVLIRGERIEKIAAHILGRELPADEG